MKALYPRAAVGALCLGTLMAASPALAHVTLETQEYPAATNAKLVLRVPHGCGQEAMINMKVRIPEGVLNVKPQPKAGWQLVTVKAKVEPPIKGDHGTQITETVREIHWLGGNLPNEHYDEFAFRAQLPDKPGTTLYIPVVQECTKGANRWIEIPEAGKTRRDLKEPAPELRLLPRK